MKLIQRQVGAEHYVVIIQTLTNEQNNCKLCDRG